LYSHYLREKAMMAYDKITGLWKVSIEANLGGNLTEFLRLLLTWSRIYLSVVVPIVGTCQNKASPIQPN
jgi:hypothetical protein